VLKLEEYRIPSEGRLLTLGRMENEEVIPHLFRMEYRKIVAVLSKRFGFEQIEIAEDIASDTFLTATQTWGMNGLPENPVAWLYSVAKNKARNHLQRNTVFEHKIAPELKSNAASSLEPDIDLSPKNIIDSQLQMMFTICHPSISPEAQIGLSLRILCGFGIEEIADAFLTTRKRSINVCSAQRKNYGEKKWISVCLPLRIWNRG